MAKSTFVLPEQNSDPTERLEARILIIKSRHTIVRKKIAAHLSHSRKKNNNADILSIGRIIIALLDAIYDSFNDAEKQEALIKDLSRLLKMLAHPDYSEYKNHTSQAFVLYFQKLIRKKEKLPTHFFAWFESYVLGWQAQAASVFVEQFDFNHCKIKESNFGLLKAASILLLEDYLTMTHVAVDRLRNAMTLLDNIKTLSDDAYSFMNLHQMLTLSKEHALQADEKANAGRPHFFRRHRFGSRYLMMLDDLSERVLYCQAVSSRPRI